MHTEGGGESPPERQQGATEAQTQQTETQTPPEWLGPISERMDQLGHQLHEQAEQIAGLYPETDEEPYEDGEFDPYDPETGDLTPEGAERIIDSRVDALLTERLSARDAEQALELREAAFEDLRERVPELQDERFAVARVRELAAELEAEGLGAIVNTPRFVDILEWQLKAGRWDDHQRESQQAEREVVLEGAGGAHQQQKAEEVDWGERIVKAAERLRPQI